MNKLTITIIVILALTFIGFRTANAQQVPPHVCNNLPSQNHNPHCQDDEAEQPVEPEQPTEPEQPVDEEETPQEETAEQTVTKQTSIKQAEVELELITEGK